MKVLIVEDGRDVALRYMRELARHGFESRVAGDVATAKRLVEELSFDAALVDMGLPCDVGSLDPEETRDNPENGLRLLDWLYEEMGIPVFALTGTLNPEKMRHIECPLIPKPVNDFEKEVVALLRRLQ